jgi:aminopeptidase N
MMRVMEELTRVDFPFNKYDQTIVANFNFGGMENITATTMADTEISRRLFRSPRGGVEDLVSHELAHSWFGNLVTCRNWRNYGSTKVLRRYGSCYRKKPTGRADYLRKYARTPENF